MEVFQNDLDFSLKFKFFSLNNLKNFRKTKDNNILKSRKNYTKLFFFFFWFFFFNLKKIYILKSYSFNFSFIKKKQACHNFLKSPGRFKMARNQLSNHSFIFFLHVFFSLAFNKAAQQSNFFELVCFLPLFLFSETNFCYLQSTLFFLDLTRRLVLLKNKLYFFPINLYDTQKLSYFFFKPRYL